MYIYCNSSQLNIVTMNQNTASVTESSNLLPPESTVESRSSMLSIPPQRKTIRSLRLKYICVPSKAATYLLFSALVVGCIYYTLLGTTVAFINSTETSKISVYFFSPLCHTGPGYGFLSTKWIHCRCLFWTIQDYSDKFMFVTLISILSLLCRDYGISKITFDKIL